MATVPAGHPEKPQGEDGRKLLLRMNGGGHEELANWGLDLLGLTGTEQQLLDVGCGGGANLQRLMERVPHAQVTGIDYSPVSVQLSSEVNAEAIAAGRCRVLEANVLALPFEDDSFDVATAFETIYFWPDTLAGLMEVHRVLKPGGHLLVSNDDDGTSSTARDIAQQIEGMKLFTAGQLEELLQSAGFARVHVHNDEEGRLSAIAVKADAHAS